MLLLFFFTLINLLKMRDTTYKTNFPSFQGSEHDLSHSHSPLKDWTMASPSEWTQEERDEKSVSIQETVCGTKALARLLAIKEAIGPNCMFDCAGRIGGDRNKKATGDETDESSIGSIASVKTLFLFCC